MLYKKYNLIKLRCNDYGFECDFVVEGEITQVIEKFGKHTDEEHGIDYSKDALMQIILRKK
jgi:predicted small metal-binding protein